MSLSERDSLDGLSSRAGAATNRVAPVPATPAVEADYVVKLKANRDALKANDESFDALGSKRKEIRAAIEEGERLGRIAREMTLRQLQSAGDKLGRKMEELKRYKDVMEEQKQKYRLAYEAKLTAFKNRQETSKTLYEERIESQKVQLETLQKVKDAAKTVAELQGGNWAKFGKAMDKLQATLVDGDVGK